MVRSNHVRIAEERIESWPQWKQEVMRQAVDSQQVNEVSSSAVVLLFPNVAKETN